MRATVVVRSAAAILALCSATLAEPPVYTAANVEAYDKGEYGIYPVNTFQTTTFPSPHILRRQWDPSCEVDDDYYYFLSPYGENVDAPGPIIVDVHGNLIWHHESGKFIHSYGLSVQQYRGESYLTWWTGDDWVHGHGFGSYYMLDNTYKEVQKLGAFNAVPADLHEFHISKDNTVLITAYVRTSIDLTMFGTDNGYIWDGVFQEYDLETQQLLFEWRASEHVDLDSPKQVLENGADGNGTTEAPWDWFHINSVDKDHLGNYLISARTYCGLLYINGRTGEVEWYLGGKYNDFKDLSGGAATDFLWQHHARWADDFSAITLFDNQVRWVTPESRQSRGLKLGVDLRRKTVRVIHSFTHPLNITGESQGSMQTLDNGNFLLGYGHAPEFTEFSPNGSVVCDLSFGPLRTSTSGNLKYGICENYRAFKLRWSGIPHYDPTVKLDRALSLLFVSWNGATEVRRWKLEETDEMGGWTGAQQIPKTGFESSFSVPIVEWSHFRLTALDKKGSPIRTWIVNSRELVQAEATSSAHPRPPQSFSGRFISYGVLVLIIAAAVRFFCVRRVSLRQPWWPKYADDLETNFQKVELYD